MQQLEMNKPVEREAAMPHPQPADLPAAVSGAASDVERFMRSFVQEAGLPGNLRSAIEYALLSPGKRLRPVLAANAAAAVGGSVESCLPAAAAVEMIHAFSLVHDDLPALDNDDLRRGRPTLHVAHGEAMAILAGDGLMSLAFQVLAAKCPPALAGVLTAELAVGNTAMIAGQVLDTLGGFDQSLTAVQKLELIHRNKTGALIRAACRMGALSIIGPAPDSDPRLVAVTRYAEAIGLMFQVVDDLLDVEQTSDHTGKRTGKDIDAGKLTYPGVLGVEASRREVQRLQQAASDALAPLGPAADGLRQISAYLAIRTK